jgi:hypothetical protein
MMTNKDSYPIRNGIIVTVIGGVLLLLIDSVRDLILRAFVLLWNTAKLAWYFFISNTSIPVWLLAFISLFSVIGVITLYKSLRPAPEPDYKKYVRDNFLGAAWRWTWYNQDISKLWCFCPTCDTELVDDDLTTKRLTYRENKTSFICENCNHSIIASAPGSLSHALSSIERQIMRKVRTGEYKNP